MGHRRSGFRALFAVLVLVLGTASTLAAQNAVAGSRVFGTVLSRSTGRPILGASVTLLRDIPSGRTTWSGITDPSGRFQTGFLPLGDYELTIEVLDFATLEGSVDLESVGDVNLRVEMTSVDFELDPVIALARRQTALESRGFYQRERMGGGYFLDREGIEDRQPSRMSDLFRQIPGVRVLQGAGLSGDVVRLRGNCIPRIVVDGLMLARPVRLDEVLSVNDVEGMEVFQGPGQVPIAYAGLTTCGVVMIWTRDPVADGTPFSWGKLAFIFGFGALFLFGPGH